MKRPVETQEERDREFGSQQIEPARSSPRCVRPTGLVGGRHAPPGVRNRFGVEPSSRG